jgi:hypothetical protein
MTLAEQQDPRQEEEKQSMRSTMISCSFRLRRPAVHVDELGPLGVDRRICFPSSGPKLPLVNQW